MYVYIYVVHVVFCVGLAASMVSKWLVISLKSSQALGKPEWFQAGGGSFEQTSHHRRAAEELWLHLDWIWMFEHGDRNRKHGRIAFVTHGNATRCYNMV